jgi:hypothetical protein
LFYVGIDKVDEMMTLLMIGIRRKYGQTMTVDEVKYNLEEFKSMVRDNLSFI